MKFLSLECSTTKASAALFDQDRLVLQRGWEEARARHEVVFEVVGAMMAEVGWSWADLGWYAVGRGPGAYSGVRVGLLAAQAWAAPGGCPVVAVSGMEAAGRAWLAATGERELMVVGDARRHSVWYGVVCGAVPEAETAWRVIERDRFAGVAVAGCPLATPHPEALSALREQSGHLRWCAEPLLPTAAEVARLALARRTAGVVSEPLTPLYMHAAV